MSGRAIRLRPKAKHFKSREKRAAFFRGLEHRTDRKARRNRQLWELDRRRIEAMTSAILAANSSGMCHGDSAARPLPSQPDAPQAGR